MVKATPFDPATLTLRDNLPAGAVVSLAGLPFAGSFASMFRDELAAEKYGVAFGVGLGEVAGKVFRIGHLGMLTDVMVLGGLATAEMCMADLGWGVRLGSGVAAAAEFYRGSAVPMAMAAE